MTETASEAKAPKRGVGFTFAAPTDAADDVATGYKVFDCTLGRFVGDTHHKRIPDSDARKAVPEGHKAAVVRV